ncbi:MAG: aryl-sulfate sulfotransferase, partial [Mycoplasmatales bacterium]
MDSLITRQFKISEEIEKEYNVGKYTPASPYIKLNPFEVCPLSALIKFSTYKPCSIIINIANDIKKHFEYHKMEHELPIIGLFSDEVNKVEITCKYVDGTEEKFEHDILTDPLPSEYPMINVVVNRKEEMYPGMILMSLGKSDGVRTSKHLYSIIDENVKIRWLYTGVACHVFSKLKNGNLIIDAPIASGICGAYTAAGFVEMDFLGKIINFFEIENGLHHDVIELPNGNFLAITQRENTKQDLLVEINRRSKKIIKEWDFREMLDFERKTVIDKISVNHSLDWLHLNSLVYEEKSNCIIASSRNQSCVVKFNKDTSQIKWIFAPPYNWKEDYQKYLLNP